MMRGVGSSDEIRSIMPLIADSTRTYEDMPALYYGDRIYSYGEVDRLSGNLASFLKDKGIGKGDVVSVLVPRCEYMTIAPLGILRAGGAYQPLDPTYPKDRLRFMIEDADAPVIIVSRELIHLIEPLRGSGKQRVILCMEDIPGLPDKKENIWENVSGDDRFVILYTSGTTGVPKGIILTHGNIYSACKWHLDHYEVDNSCRMGQHPSFVFDLAIVELLLPLTAGASIYIIPEEIRTDIKKLNEFLENNRITHLTMTTQLGRQFAMTVSNHFLRHLTVGGEALISVVPPSEYKLHNDYGPAECTLYTTIFTVDKEYPGKVPIGRAVDEVRLYVVDEKGQEAGDETIGELCIAGPHVALGYLNRPELTDKAFTDNPFSDEPEYKRMYHSGDLVIRHSDGVFEFMGRADRQVKIRGIRIEPAELEELLRKHEEIEDVVISTPEAGSQRVIAAYYISPRELDTKELEDYVLKYKPSYMCPSFFIRIDSIPLNTNGKVDYEKLPQPDFKHNKEAYEEPVNDTEKQLALIYEELLNIDQVGRNDDFMRIGGNSLLVTQLLYQIEKRFSRSLSTRDIMENPVIASLADLIDKGADTDPGFRQVDDKPLLQQDFYPASKAQERIYTAQKLLKDDDPTYLLSMTIRTEAKPDISRTEDVLCKLFEHHESLRTEFGIKDSGVVQKIYPADAEWIRKAVKKAYTKERPVMFRLEEAPLFWWSLGDDGFTFYWHHIINDGTGTAMFGREFAVLYNNGRLNAPVIHQKEYASWEHEWMASDAYKSCMEGWKEQMSEYAGAEEPRLPYDGISGSSDRRKAGHVRLELDRNASDEIKKSCRDLSVTPYMFFVSVFSVLLYKYTGIDRFLIGTAVDGRGQRNTAKLQGMFANTLPIPVSVSDSLGFSDLLASIRNSVLFMLDNRQASLEDIASVFEDLGGLRRTTHGRLLFDILFVMRDFDSVLPDMDGCASKLYWPYDDMPMYDLTLEAGMEEGSYYFVFEYDRALFDEESINWLSRHYRTLLDSCVRQDAETISDISMTDEEERKLILDHGTGPDEVFGSDTVIDRLRRQTEVYPDKKAVVYDDSYMSYKELWEISGKIAEKLLKVYSDCDDLKPGEERWVGIIAERGLSMIASIIGILRSGAGYVPISPQYPGERIVHMLSEADADIVVVCDVPDADKNYLKKRKEQLPVIEVSSEELRGFTSDEKERCGLPVIMPEQNAYMIFTSGSTGQPKGVVVEHRQLSALFDAYKSIYELDSNDTVLQFASFVFDQSVWDIFHILTVGGTLCVIPDDIVKDPERLAEYCEDKGVTAASLTPGFLRLMDPMRLKKLRLLDVGGEAPSRSLLEAWSKGRTVFNTYGPTETTVNATSFMFAHKGRILQKVHEDKENVPIGRAVPGTRTYVLSGSKLSGIGVPGELCIAGRQVTRGYHNRKELTDERYVKDPFGEGRMYKSGDLVRMLADGNIEFISRMDDQVKIRGYRIEAGEIESVMRSFSKVSDAVVMIRGKEGEEKRLCGYYIPQNGDFSEQGIMEIRAELEKRLPIYMIPSVLIPVEEIKLTVNGKTDRRALPDPAEYLADRRENKERVLPMSQEERDCIEVFEEVLNIKDLRATDDFLASGGDSIKAIRIVSLLRKKGYSVDAGTLLRSRTVRGLCACLRTDEHNGYREFEEIIPTPVMRMFAQAGMINPSYYDQSAIYSIKGDTDIRALEWTLNALVQYHGMLRMILKDDGSIRIRNKEEISKTELPVYIDIDEDQRVKVMNALNASMDPKDGRIMRAALFREASGDRLFLTFHHYVIDEVSWEIITDDLNSLYDAASVKGDKEAGYENIYSILPPMTVSFGEWSQALVKYREFPDFIPERDYWKRVHEEIGSYREAYAGLLEALKEDKAPEAEGFGRVIVDIGKDISDKLLRLSKSRYRTRPDAVLAAVFVKTINSLYGSSSVMLQMESHGRGNIGKGIKSDRTVGWFTAVYPVLIPVLKSIDEQIIQVKEEMASVQNCGLGYGLLYEDLVDIGGFVFNYLGDLRSRHGDLIEYTDEYAGEESDVRNTDPKTISVNIRAYDTGIRIECVYDRVYSGKKVSELINEYKSMLDSSVEMISDEGEVISPSDLCAFRIMSMRDWNRLISSVQPADIASIGTPTPLQQGMLYRMIAQPDTGAYMLQDRLFLKGEWKKDEFCKALMLAAIRFDALRIRFAINGYEEPWQIIMREGVSVPEYREISARNMEDIAADDLKRGFDPEKDVMFRVTFNKDSADMDLKELLVSSHHCILDGWSFRILTDAVADWYFRMCGGESYARLYEEAVREASEGLKFSQYLTLTANRDIETSLEQWDSYLDGVNEGACIGQSAENENIGPAGYMQLSVVGEDEAKIRKYAQNGTVTLSSFFGTVFGILLGFENDMSDIVFGETVSGRNVNAEGIEDAVGMFINTIPVRIKWDADIPVSQIIRQRQEDYLRMQPYENVPLDKIMSRKKAGAGLIRTLYVYENYPAGETDDRYRVVMQHEEVDYPLSVSIEENDGFSIEVQYDKRRYERSFIEKLLGRYYNLILQIISDENITVSELERIPESERKYMLSDISGIEKPFPGETFLDMMYANVKDNPDKCAVIMDGRSLSYEQLWRASSALAAELKCTEECFVAVYADRSFGMIVSLIASFMAGAAYVPLDPDFPDDRLSFILSDCSPVAVLRCINQGTEERTGFFEDEHLRIIDVCVDELLSREGTDCYVPGAADDSLNTLAYMIYTSGTTGRPKGVEIEHEALAEMIRTNREFYGDTFDVTLQTANYVFDASVLEIYGPLACGGTICMISRDKLSSSEVMARYCKDNKVSFFASTNAFLQALDAERFEPFKVISVGGDAANADIFSKWAKRTGLLVNDYGPTEACVNALAYKYIPGHTGSIPIGRPYINKKVYIMQNDKLCGIGQKGEICIGGRGLARGYHNREELNSQAFVSNPYTKERIYRTGDIGYFGTDGEVYCLGRYDDQIKIRGYRIETGEIESRIREFGSVREAAVISRNDNGREAYLAAYITGDDAVDTDMLKAYLKKKLPSYMVPVAIVKLDSLPRNASDKLDMEALPVPVFTEHKAAPEGYLEEMTAGLYEKILGIDNVGRDDSFFELGGSSLDLMRLVSELSAYDINIADFAGAPTPRLFGEFLLNRSMGRERKKTGITLLKEGIEDKPALFCIPPSGGMSLCYLPLIKELDYDGRIYGITDNKYTVFADMTMEELAVYEPCKADMWDDTIEYYCKGIKGLFKDGDILVGYSQGGPAAFLTAGKLESAGFRVGKVIMLEAAEPGISYGDEDRYERMVTAAAIFAGRTEADLSGVCAEHKVQEVEYFKNFLRENFGDDADNILLHSIFETYLVYSSNVLNPLTINGKIKAEIDSMILCDAADMNESEVAVRNDDPWSLYSESKGEAYVVCGPEGDHLAFLSKYKKQISRIVKNSLMK